MQSVYVSIAVKNAGMAVHESLGPYLAGPAALPVALHISRMYRRMGVGFLFISGVPDSFFVHLSHSARAFLHFLENAADEEKATSKADPLFDALACGDDDAARRIAASSRLTWNPEREYEDDFLYADFILERSFRGAKASSLRAILQRYEVVLEGAKEPRWDVCKSILDGNQTAFHAAVDAWTERYEDALKERSDDELLDPEEASTTALLSTELLALLRLADSASLKTRPGYRFAPDVARMLTRARLPDPQAWRHSDPSTDLG